MAEFKQNRWDNFFYNQHINKVTPHFTFMRRAQNADTHAHKQHWLSQNILPVGSSFVLIIASDMHLEPESENERKMFIFTQLKISRYSPHFFAIFRRILIKWPPTYLLKSDLLGSPQLAEAVSLAALLVIRVCFSSTADGTVNKPRPVAGYVCSDANTAN